MQKAQTNLFPAFEGPEHQNLHTKGNGCVCNPFFKVEMRDEAEITHFRHQPLSEANKAKPPEWLKEEGLSLSNGETLLVDGETGSNMNVGITGHQNIPTIAHSFVAGEIRRLLTNLKKESPLVGISSLAAGADQLFASIVLLLGGRLHVIVPSEDYSSTFTLPDDLDKFHELVNQADHVETLDFTQSGEDAYLSAGRRIVDQSELLVAVWDGLPAKGMGGTADIVDYAKNRGVAVRVIWPEGVRR